MTLMQLLACAGMITGAFLILGLKPMEFTDGLFGFLMQKPRTLKEEINEATSRKKPGVFRREIRTAQEILDMTGRESRFSMICAVSLSLFCVGGSLAILMGNYFLAPVLAVGFLFFHFLEKKRAVNKGIVPQYYIEGNHEAIIPRELFYQVQEERARRANVYRPANKKGSTIRGRYSSKYVLADIMYCKECGQPYRRQVWVNGGTKKPVWRCYSRLKSGTKKCKHSPSLEEKALHEAIMEAVNSVVKDEGEFIDAFRDNVIRILGSYSDNVEPTEYDEKIDSLQKQMMALIEDSAKTESADEEFDRAYREIADQIRVFKKKRTELLREKQLAEAYDQRVEGMGQYIRKTNYLKRQFDDELVRRLIKGIKVISEDKIEIQFHSGIVMTQRIDDYD